MFLFSLTLTRSTYFYIIHYPLNCLHSKSPFSYIKKGNNKHPPTFSIHVAENPISIQFQYYDRLTASIFSDLSCLFLARWPNSINNSSINQHEEQQPTNELKLKQELFLCFFFLGFTRMACLSRVLTVSCPVKPLYGLSSCSSQNWRRSRFADASNHKLNLRWKAMASESDSSSFAASVDSDSPDRNATG